MGGWCRSPKAACRPLPDRRGGGRRRRPAKTTPGMAVTGGGKAWIASRTIFGGADIRSRSVPKHFTVGRIEGEQAGLCLALLQAGEDGVRVGGRRCAPPRRPCPNGRRRQSRRGRCASSTGVCRWRLDPRRTHGRTSAPPPGFPCRHRAAPTWVGRRCRGRGRFPPGSSRRRR